MKQSGDWGEALVAEYLRTHGYRLLAAQYHCRFGEIDLIAQKKNVLCFVEVKLRTNLAHGLPREFVHTAKQNRLRAAASMYIAEHNIEQATRFDVAEVYTDETHSEENTKINYIENAFF